MTRFFLGTLVLCTAMVVWGCNGDGVAPPGDDGDKAPQNGAPADNGDGNGLPGQPAQPGQPGPTGNPGGPAAPGTGDGAGAPAGDQGFNTSEQPFGGDRPFQPQGNGGSDDDLSFDPESSSGDDDFSSEVPALP